MHPRDRLRDQLEKRAVPEAEGHLPVPCPRIPAPASDCVVLVWRAGHTEYTRCAAGVVREARFDRRALVSLGGLPGCPLLRRCRGRHPGAKPSRPMNSAAKRPKCQKLDGRKR